MKSKVKSKHYLLTERKIEKKYKSRENILKFKLKNFYICYVEYFRIFIWNICMWKGMEKMLFIGAEEEGESKSQEVQTKHAAGYKKNFPFRYFPTNPLIISLSHTIDR